MFPTRRDRPVARLRAGDRRRRAAGHVLMHRPGRRGPVRDRVGPVASSCRPPSRRGPGEFIGELSMLVEGSTTPAGSVPASQLQCLALAATTSTVCWSTYPHIAIPMMKVLPAGSPTPTPCSTPANPPEVEASSASAPQPLSCTDVAPRGGGSCGARGRCRTAAARACRTSRSSRSRGRGPSSTTAARTRPGRRPRPRTCAIATCDLVGRAVRRRRRPRCARRSRSGVGSGSSSGHTGMPSGRGNVSRYRNSRLLW